MATTTRLGFIIVSLVSFSLAAQTAPIDYSAAYGECTQALQRNDVDEALAKCESPARGGVPGAQYAIGALLSNRARGNDAQQGLEWLEKAAAAGHPAAAFHLASLLVQRTDEASVTRGRELFRMAVCVDYPTALTALTQAGASKDAIHCPTSAERDFSGEWLLSLKWDKSGPAGSGSTDYKISIDGDTARVYGQWDGKWTEVKPGKFTITREDESLTVSVTDKGWDSDGKRIESWTIQMMRTGVDEAAVAYLRTVNNPNLPARFNWRTFATFAEGTARRNSGK